MSGALEARPSQSSASSQGAVRVLKSPQTRAGTRGKGRAGRGPRQRCSLPAQDYGRSPRRTLEKSTAPGQSWDPPSIPRARGFVHCRQIPGAGHRSPGGRTLGVWGKFLAQVCFSSFLLTLSFSERRLSSPCPSAPGPTLIPRPKQRHLPRSPAPPGWRGLHLLH